MEKQKFIFNINDDDYVQILRYLEETIRLFRGSSKLLALKFLGTHSCLLSHFDDKIMNSFQKEKDGKKIYHAVFLINSDVFDYKKVC